MSPLLHIFTTTKIRICKNGHRHICTATSLDITHTHIKHTHIKIYVCIYICAFIIPRSRRDPSCSQHSAPLAVLPTDTVLSLSLALSTLSAQWAFSFLVSFVYDRKRRTISLQSTKVRRRHFKCTDTHNCRFGQRYIHEDVDDTINISKNFTCKHRHA